MTTANLRIGLALGGGGARGLAHIPMLEAFDEAGLVPSAMAGCSMGSLVGVCYAAGIPAQEIRNHAVRLLSNRIDLLKHVFGGKKYKPLELLSFSGFKSLHLSAERLVRIALPDDVPERIEDLKIPMKIVATNYSTMREHVFTEGPIVEAVAASIAIPGLISGSLINEELYVDGGLVNPVPFNHLRQQADKIIAVDVTGKPKLVNGNHPSNIETAIGSLLIMFHQIAGLRRAADPPDLYFEPDVTNIGSGDFFRVQDILAAAEPEKKKLFLELSKLKQEQA
jgi:NTE family protein